LDDTGAPQVRGTLVRRDQAGLSVLIPIANRQVGFLQSPIGRQVTIAPDAVIQIEERMLSKGRTALTLGAGAALVGTVIFFVLDDARQATPTPGGPGDDAIRIPLFTH
jgi:hypothetical protein